MKSSTAFESFDYLFTTFTTFLLLFVRFSGLWILTAPLSLLDNMDADLDCVLDDDLTSAMPTTSTPTDLTPTALVEGFNAAHVGGGRVSFLLYIL